MDTNQVGRNEPCPCGSGKKYKRCHGVDAAPKLTESTKALPGAAGAGAEGANPLAGMDPQMMAQLSQALQRLPRGQMQRLQGIMQKAMSGRDVSAEAAEFEKTLPLDMQNLLRSFQMPGLPGMEPAPSEEPMTEEKARQIVAEAAAQGKISTEEAAALTGGEVAQPQQKGLGKLWRNWTGAKT